VTGRDSRPIPDRKTGKYFIERIQQGAFRKALQKAETVKALVDHKKDRVIGDTGSNFKLQEDVIGLRAHLETDDAEVVKAAKEKRLRGWSFNILHPVETRAEHPSGMPLRSLSDFDMTEVSLIINAKPWYESTTVETRAEGNEEEIEIRAEEFEASYIGFEDNDPEPKVPDHSKLKETIEKYGGTI